MGLREQSCRIDPEVLPVLFLQHIRWNSVSSKFDTQPAYRGRLCSIRDVPFWPGIREIQEPYVRSWFDQTCITEEVILALVAGAIIVVIKESDSAQMVKNRRGHEVLYERLDL